MLLVNNLFNVKSECIIRWFCLKHIPGYIHKEIFFTALNKNRFYRCRIDISFFLYANMHAHVYPKCCIKLFCVSTLSKKNYWNTVCSKRKFMQHFILCLQYCIVFVRILRSVDDMKKIDNNHDKKSLILSHGCLWLSNHKLPQNWKHEVGYIKDDIESI